jgi:hypothetical protein
LITKVFVFLKEKRNIGEFLWKDVPFK